MKPGSIKASRQDLGRVHFRGLLPFMKQFSTVSPPESLKGMKTGKGAEWARQGHKSRGTWSVTSYTTMIP